jgi:hypothetical protein
MSRFVVTVARTATAYFTAEVEADTLEQVKEHLHRQGYTGNVLTNWSTMVITAEVAEKFHVTDEFENELYERIFQ